MHHNVFSNLGHVIRHPIQTAQNVRDIATVLGTIAASQGQDLEMGHGHAGAQRMAESQGRIFGKVVGGAITTGAAVKGAKNLLFPSNPIIKKTATTKPRTAGKIDFDTFRAESAGLKPQKAPRIIQQNKNKMTLAGGITGGKKPPPNIATRQPTIFKQFEIKKNEPPKIIKSEPPKPTKKEKINIQNEKNNIVPQIKKQININTPHEDIVTKTDNKKKISKKKQKRINKALSASEIYGKDDELNEILQDIIINEPTPEKVRKIFFNYSSSLLDCDKL